ncbi:MAG: response regulator [Thermoleophilia bacterium]|nr:response regulator [Thermoleophilia bacterium]
MSREAAGRTVLVVDDDDALRMLCRVNLELDGYRVLEAATVDEAAAHTESERVDVVLLDVRLGDTSQGGLALLDRLPAGEHGPAVALLTGSIDRSRFTQPDRVAAVISKPFALEELADVVRRLAASV